MHPQRQQLLERDRPWRSSSSAASAPRGARSACAGSGRRSPTSKPRTTTGCARRAAARPRARARAPRAGRSPGPAGAPSPPAPPAGGRPRRGTPRSAAAAEPAQHGAPGAISSPSVSPQVGRASPLPRRRLGNRRHGAGGLAAPVSLRLRRRPRRRQRPRLRVAPRGGGLVAGLAQRARGGRQPGHRRRGGQHERSGEGASASFAERRAGPTAPSSPSARNACARRWDSGR